MKATAVGLATVLFVAGAALAHERTDGKGAAGFVRKAADGEVLLDTPRGVEIIKVGPEDSRALGVATTRFKMKGPRIAEHAHDEDDEVFFVHEGGGIFLLDGARIPVAKGDVAFVPRGTWHGFENESPDTLLVWAISASRYLELHRRFFKSEAPPSPAEIEAIFERYGFRDRTVERKPKATSADPEEAARRELLALVAAYDRAQLARDVAFFDELLAEDFTASYDTGTSETRAEYLAALKGQREKPTYRLVSLRTENVVPRILGSGAVMTGDWVAATAPITDGGEPLTSRGRFTSVLEKRDGRWRIVAEHMSTRRRAPPKE